MIYIGEYTFDGVIARRDGEIVPWSVEYGTVVTLKIANDEFKIGLNYAHDYMLNNREINKCGAGPAPITPVVDIEGGHKVALAFMPRLPLPNVTAEKLVTPLSKKQMVSFPIRYPLKVEHLIIIPGPQLGMLYILDTASNRFEYRFSLEPRIAEIGLDNIGGCLEHRGWKYFAADGKSLAYKDHLSYIHYLPGPTITYRLEGEKEFKFFMYRQLLHDANQPISVKTVPDSLLSHPKINLLYGSLTTEQAEKCHHHHADLATYAPLSTRQVEILKGRFRKQLLNNTRINFYDRIENNLISESLIFYQELAEKPKLLKTVKELCQKNFHKDYSYLPYFTREEYDEYWGHIHPHHENTHIYGNICYADNPPDDICQHFYIMARNPSPRVLRYRNQKISELLPELLS